MNPGQRLLHHHAGAPAVAGSAANAIAHAGDHIAAALCAHGVRHLFTLCGGHISPILAAAKARGIRIVDVRDEATAVFAADATARLSGVPGVAAVTAGPGITNTITALKNAQLAQSPVILIGGAAPTALQGRSHPLQMRHARRQALREADCVLLAGVPCDFRLDYGRHVRRSATLVAANRSAREAPLNRRPDVAAIGDAGQFIRALAQTLPTPTGRWAEWTATLRARDQQRESEIDQQAAREGDFVNPLAFFRALEAEAGEDAVFVADGGDFVGTASYVLHPRGPLTWLDPGAFGTLGVGAGFALGAALSDAGGNRGNGGHAGGPEVLGAAVGQGAGMRSAAGPGRETWVIFGDGACGWSLAELDSFVRQRIPVIAVVGNDAGWTQIAREQVKMLGDDVGTVLARAHYHEVAAGFGAEGLLIQRGYEVRPVLRRARELARQGKTVLVNVWLDKTEFREGSLSM